MTITAAVLTGNERAPGDFQRTAMGAPYVNHPTETTKDGRPKRVVYGRPSGFGKALDNPYNLLKWKERKLLAGVAELDPDWSTVDFDNDKAVDGLVNDCYDASDTDLSARRGTHGHLLTEADDRGEDPTLLWPAGVELGIPVELQRRLVEQWRLFRAALGVEALAIEATVVHDDWRVAGTLDRLDKATRPIVTALGTIQAGEALIGDIKTGSLTVDNKGTPKFWLLYPVQIAAYADGVPYDTDTELRGVWPVTPHRDIALIYHYDLTRAIGGEVVDWQAIPVSLAAGRAGGQIAYAAKEFSWRRDLFAAPVTISEAACTSASEAAAAGAADTPPAAAAVDAREVIRANPVLAANLSTLAHTINTWPTDVKQRLAAVWPSTLATPRAVRDGHAVWGVDDVPALQAVMHAAEAPWTVLDRTLDSNPQEDRWTTSNSPSTKNSSPESSSSTTFGVTSSTQSTGSTTQPNSSGTHPKTSPPPPTNSPSSNRFADVLDSHKDLPPDDGGPLDPRALEALLADAVDVKMVINMWLVEATAAGCNWNPRKVGTVRSFEQARAARALASMWDDSPTGELFVRLIVKHATGTHWETFVGLGVVIGHLTIPEARAVVDTVDAINGGRLTLRYDDNGTPQLAAT